MSGIHERQQDRPRSAPQLSFHPANSNPAPLRRRLLTEPAASLSDWLTIALICAVAVVAGVVSALLLGVVTVVLIAFNAAGRPAFWLGVVVIATLAHLAGWW